MALRLGWAAGPPPIVPCRNAGGRTRATALPAAGRGEGTANIAAPASGAGAAPAPPPEGQNVLLTPAAAILAAAHAGEKKLETVDVGRSTNIRWFEGMVDREDKELLLGQTGSVLWFTGLSGSGKSAIARSLEQMLHASGHLTMLLDGSSVRRGLCQDLGFSPEERRERIRRIGEVAKLFADAGAIMLCCFISPSRADRDAVRARCRKGEFIEVYVDTPPELCERHDYRGLYSGARAGRIQNVMGVDAPYEPPLAPEIVLAACDSEGRLRSPASLAQSVFDALEQGGYLRDPAIPSLAVCRALQHKHSDGILDYSCL